MRLSPLPLALTVLALVGACPREDPTPTKVIDRNAIGGQQPPPKRETPFNNGNIEPPPPRSEPQLGPDELEAALIGAAQDLDAGRVSEALIALRKCANKLPPSARCDGELGMALLENKLQKAHARYFVAEAAKHDDPDADLGFYRRLAKSAQRHGRSATAVDAMKIAIGRPGVTADDWALYAEVLQHDQANLEQAIDALGRAYSMQPDQHRWLRDQAILVAQTNDTKRAIELFERYKDIMRSVPHEVQMAEQRIAELKAPPPATPAVVKKKPAAPE
jgi:tetratricopeptide (TPR) repeat protein